MPTPITARISTGPIAARSAWHPRYDFLGRFLAEGFLVYELDEQRPGGSRIRKDRLYRSLNNLIIAHDSYGPWHWSLTVGDEVRTEFTPLTLRQGRF